MISKVLYFSQNYNNRTQRNESATIGVNPGINTAVVNRGCIIRLLFGHHLFIRAQKFMLCHNFEMKENNLI